MSFPLALVSVDEKQSISLTFPVDSGTGIPGPYGTGFMAEETLGYFRCFCSSDLFLK